MKHTPMRPIHRRPGMIVLGLAALVTVYLLALAAIDTARLVYYFGALVFTVLGIRWIVVGIRGR